jgi:hypothetical protein
MLFGSVRRVRGGCGLSDVVPAVVVWVVGIAFVRWYCLLPQQGDLFDVEMFHLSKVTCEHVCQR